MQQAQAHLCHIFSAYLSSYRLDYHHIFRNAHPIIESFQKYCRHLNKQGRAWEEQSKGFECLRCVYYYNCLQIENMNSKHSRNKSREANFNKILQPHSYEEAMPFQNKNRTISSKQLIKHAISLPRQPENQLEVNRKSSQINSLHQQYNLLKDQMKKFPDKAKSNDSQALSRAKERSQAVYVEDQKSQSSEESPYYRKAEVLPKKRQQFPHFEQKNEENYFRKSFKKSQKESNEVYSNDSKHSKEKQSSSSFQANNPNLQRMKSSSQSSPPLPSRKMTIGPQTKTSKQFSEIITPEKESIRIPHFNSQRPINIKSKLQRFSMEIENGMENMLQKFEELEKKYLSLDLYFEQLRRSVAQRGNAQSKNKEISQAKHRQLNFLLGEYEAKVKQVKADNERLEKQLISAKIREEYSKGQLQQAQLRQRETQKLQQSYEKMKKAKLQLEKNLQQAESKASKLEKERANLYIQLQKEKSRKVYEPEHSIVKQQANMSHFVSSSTLFGTSEDTDYLKQQISKLQYENKEYEKLISGKSLQISNLARNIAENKMMMNKIKELNEQLQRQCQKLHKENAQKQLQATEKICGLNNTIKKKLKEYDSFKDLILDCLTEIYKKAPKKIRKGFEAEISNKNRTSKCQVIFKCINTSFAYYQDLTSTINESLLRDFPISPVELEKSGYQICLKKIKEDSAKMIESSKAESRLLQAEIQRLKGQLVLKSQEIQSLKQHQEDYFVLKKGRSQNPKKEMPTNDFDQRHSQSGAQELAKRKAEIDKLNKQVNRLIEQSHGKYLKYQEQIANLQMKEKQYIAKLAEHQIERSDFISKTTQKENQFKALQKNIGELKAEREVLVARISELSNQTKKLVMQGQSKLHRSQQQVEALKKKVKKTKEQGEQNEKVMQIKLTVKDKTINDLLEEKKKFTVQTKILTEKIQFAKIMEENKEKPQPKNVEALPQRLHQEQIEKIKEKVKTMNGTIQQQEEEIKHLGSFIKSINLNLAEKDKLLERAQLELHKKQEQAQKLTKQYKEKQSRKSHMNEQYKKMAEQAKKSREQLQKKMEQEREKRSKELTKMTKQIQAKEEEYLSLTRQKTDDAHRCKEFQQKLSQKRRENEELLNLVHKRQYEIEERDNTIREEREAVRQLESKCLQLENELKERQQYFKKSESLMQQLVNQNNQNKQQMEKKEQQILILIQQKQELNFRLSEDLDERSENMKIVQENHQGQLALLKEQLQATQINLQTTKEELRLKNALIAELKEKGSNEKREASGSKQRESYESKLSEYREEIENLNNRIDILQEQLEEMKVCLQDREAEMDAAKRQKNKYYKILQQKAEYIDQLQEAVKLKFSEVGPMREVNEDFEEQREQYEENEEKLKQEIEDLHQTIKQLEEKSIQAVNSLKKDVEVLKKEVEESKGQLGARNAKSRILVSEKEELAKQLQGKEGQLIHVMHRYEELKIRASEELNAKSEYLQEVLADKENCEQKLKLYSEMMLMKEKIYKQEVEEITSQLKDKDQQIATLQTKAPLAPITEHKSQNELLNLSHQAFRLAITRLQEEKSQLQRKLSNLEKELTEKLGILNNLNFKIETMDSNISDLQFKLESWKHENKLLKAKLESRGKQAEPMPFEELSEQLQQRLQELDEKEHQLHQLREQHRRALKAQANQFSANLDSYRSNFGILEKQLNTYKETNIILTLKCQSLERQFRELAEGKGSKNFIVSQSPNNLDFASVQLDPPDKSNVLKNLLSQSLFDIDA